MNNSKDDTRWRVSSYSNGDGQCVETAVSADVVGARDTKDLGHGPELWVSSDTWRAFVHAATTSGLTR
ncbi:DUF397 domain-containing protein [Streptomyces sp. RFCAC02]|uniref:DUF397 domain-containing protein n=1 Tax=Streptomyces sp. RFCAC02 TaxID=2499143 RepID=UPI00101EDFF7|nr:DUF397 domain-containing protein [Streptomyces sp. RFCAC02]